ncbi:alpha-galactosidase D [Jatrophihabitans sp. YIM 134969]
MSPQRPVRRPSVRSAARAGLAAALAVGALAACGTASAAPTPSTPTPGAAAVSSAASSLAATAAAGSRVDPSQGAAAKPYMGWSSWSLQSSNYPGLNPGGNGSWLTEDHVLQQEQVLATQLKSHGYTYLNIDSGWSDRFDEWGRPIANPDRFPHGLAWLADKAHADGLKLGTYLAVGLDKRAYDDGNTPIFGTTSCHTRDVVYPDLRTTNGWDLAYKMDFSNQCAQAYVNSIAMELADWHVDFLKLDGVGPGSNKGGPQYDNTTDVAAWSIALRATARPIQFVLSWALSPRQSDTWRQYTNGWRVDTDVECYCDTLVTWNNSVKQRFDDVVPFLDLAGLGRWNNLDSLDVGVGAMDGLTDAERQTYTSFWALQAAPLYLGDDLTKLDAYGRSLITNDEVIAVDQAGRVARPVDQRSQQQTWYSRNPDGSVVVGQFNLADSPARVTTKLTDVGLSGTAVARDLWKHKNLGGASGQFGATLPAHGSRLLVLTPVDRTATAVTGLRATSATSSGLTLAWNAAPRRGSTYVVRVDGAKAVTTTSTTATVGGFAADSRHTVTVGLRGTGGAVTATSTPLTLNVSAAGGPVTYEAEAPSSVLAGGASRGDCSACSGGAKVGNLGYSQWVTLTGVQAPRAGTYVARLSYLDGDSARQVQVSVNGGTPVWVNAVGTNDNDWSTPHTVTVYLPLAAGANDVQLLNTSGYMPDIDALTV